MSILAKLRSITAIETKSLPLGKRMIALEPRYVFDAAIAQTIEHLAEAADPAPTSATADDHVASQVVSAADAIAADRVADIERASADQAIDVLVAMRNSAPSNTEIAFIDRRLADLSTLISAVPEGTRIVLVDPNRDGVAQMAEALAGRSGITGIHIVSHGSAGSIALGASTLDAASMAGIHRDALAEIAAHLSEDADILVYGCNFADGEKGAEAVDLLARLTGADVAASEDLTGSAEKGGDWDLEVRQGSIEAGLMQAMNWNGVLDPLTISATAAPVVRDNTGAVVVAGSTTIGGITATRHITDVTRMVGATALWTNAGMVGTNAIDLRATVLSVVDTNPNAGHAPGLHFTISNGDDPSVRIDNAEVRIRWDAFAAGTYDPVSGTGVAAVGDVGFFIRDIDALGHIYSAPGVMTYVNMAGIKPQESVRADYDELASYQTEALGDTHLTVGLNIDPDTGLTVTDPASPSYGKITATNLVDTEFAESKSGVKFNWIGVGSWEVTYRVAPPPGTINLDAVPANGIPDTSLSGLSHGQRFFDHDGDGDLTFASAYTVDMRHLDLDGDDSTATGDDYVTTYVENGAGVSVVDTDVDISGFDTRIASAQVVLTNAMAGDRLLVGGSAAASGTVNGLAYTVGSAGGVITIDIIGSVTDPAIYEAALRQITFDNTSDPPDATDRIVNVKFNNGTVDSNTAVSTIRVVTVNDPPVLTDPRPGVPGSPEIDPADPTNLLVPATDGAPLTLSAGDYFTDPNGDPLTITPDAATMPGWLSYDPVTQTFTGTPPADNTGPVVISVEVDDGRGGTVAATLTIQPSNPAPDAVADATTTPYGTPVVVNLLANDTDADGDPLTVTVATLADPSQGTLTRDPVSGAWTFTPAAGFSGAAVINYTIADQDGATDTATHTVTVANAPPVLTDPRPGVPGSPEIDPADPTNLLVPATDGAPLTLSAGDYFTDPNGDPLTITPDAATMPGWLSYDPVTQTFTGTPPADNTGHVVISVEVDDGQGGTVAATLTIQPSNPAPDAVADATTTPYGTPVVVNLLANDTDADGDPLTVTVATLADPSQGTLTRDPVSGAWTFTPAAGFSGAAVINYTIADQDGATDTATHTVTVALPPAPIAVIDRSTTAHATQLDGSVAGNDTFVSGTTFQALSPPTTGTLTFNSDGTFSYVPETGFVGTETFVYQITDPFGQTALAVQVIRVTPPPIVAVTDIATTPLQTVLNGNAAANDTTVSGATYVAITAPQHGAVVMNSDGTYVYTPGPGFTGADMFAYAVTDILGQTRFASVAITVTPPPGPVAVDDAYTTHYSTQLSASAAAGDTYASGVTFAAVSQPTHGTLIFNADGTYSYTPTVGFAGTDTFTYRVTDAYGQTSTATETITVDAPQLIAVDDTFSSIYGVPVVGNAASGDTFAPGSTFSVATPPANGTVNMNPNGTYTFTPAPGFVGTTTFTYSVVDPVGQSLTATETITITPPALVATADTVSGAFNTPVTGNAAIGDTFAPGSVFSVATPPSSGTVQMSPDGSFTYTAAPNFFGTVTFTYQIVDPTGQVRSATETVVIGRPQLVAVGESYATANNTPFDGNAAIGDTFAPGSVFAVVGGPSRGSVTMGTDGRYRYLPFADFSGTDTFTYSITDPTGQVATATQSITVAARTAIVKCLTTFGRLNIVR